MSHNELKFLRTEIGTLTRFLEDLSEDNFIERIQLERRLAHVRERLAEIEHLPQAKPLPITFRGTPVEGTRSIDAGFGAAALKAFIEATDTVAASLTSEELKDSGPLPGGRERSLRIVDTALGSFGFELELPPLAPEERRGGRSWRSIGGTSLTPRRRPRENPRRFYSFYPRRDGCFRKR